MESPVQLPQRRGREGNRWVNERPTPEKVAEWFEASVRLHDGMEHKDWVGGISLIQTTEEHDEVVGFGDDGRPTIVAGVQHVFYVPYPKVETRVDYFKSLTATHNEGAKERDRWTDFILPVPAKESGGMPVGYFPAKVTLPDGRVATLVGYTAQATIFEGPIYWEERLDPDGVTRRYPNGDIVFQGAHGTKTVPVLDRWGGVNADAFAWAQTGANGRALGFAGILVIPGTGVATAEDMIESQQGGKPQAAPAAPQPQEGQTPVDTDPEALLRQRTVEMLSTLQNDYPEALKTFQAWARERKFGSLDTIGGPALKGVVKKLEKTLDQARQSSTHEGGLADLDISGDAPEPETPVAATTAPEETL